MNSDSIKKKEVVFISEEEHMTTTTTATTTQDESPPLPSNKKFTRYFKLILPCLGYAIGYVNIWRFPYLCYKNGGAAFLIAYLTMLVSAGIPLFFMDLLLGQYASLGPAALFPELAPVFTGLGWSMFVAILLVTIYYNHVMAWSCYYAFSSFTSALPWSNCDNYFNSEDCVTHEELSDCTSKSLFYHNKTCLTIEEYCNIASAQSLNETYCIGGENGTDILLPEETVSRMSPAEDFYRNRLLRVTGKTWDDMGAMNWEIVGCLALAWALVCISMVKGIKTTKKVVYFIAVVPYVCLLILLVRGLTLEGAYDGIYSYTLNLNMTQLEDPLVWYDALTQLFFSLGIGFGVFITLSSYNNFKENCMRDAIAISIANSVTSFFWGLAVFSVLGFIAHEIGVPVVDVVHSGSGLAFIAFSTAVAEMPCPPFWSILFFVTLIALGIGSQFAFVETLATSLGDLFSFPKKRKPLLIAGSAIVCFLLGLPMCLEGGIYIFELLNVYAVGFSLLFIAFCEVIVVGYMYGFVRIASHIKKDMGIPLHQFFSDYWSVAWLCYTPLSIIALFGFGLYYAHPAGFGSYIFPEGIQGIGWLITATPIVPIPIGALYAIFRKGKKGKELISTTQDFCPAHLKNKETISPFNCVLDNRAFEPDSKSTENQSGEPSDVAEQESGSIEEPEGFTRTSSLNGAASNV